MIHRLTALILIPLLLVSNLSMMMVNAGFELNRDYIVSKLCENREKPQMNCNGKCYLDKKLKQAEEKEKKQEREIQNQLFQNAFLPVKLFVFFNAAIIIIINTPYKYFIARRHNSAVFHPPKA